MAKAQEIWEKPVARIWMRSPNGHLNGARPIDVLKLRGEQEVLDALEATRAGVYA